ncbi:MAG: hypothetical protein Q9Q40_12450 [Acidobacteriota bacterium]|nr:hypothetical protein [Acidobacteriota bacterium]
MRLHIPAAWALNPDGSAGPTPDGWPSLAWDPVGDVPEVAWSRHDGTDYEIVISRWSGDRWTDPETLTTNSVDDQDPEFAYAPDGTARITYWSEGKVYWLTRPPLGAWSAPVPVDAGVKSSVTSSVEELVAYQRPTDPSGTEVVVSEGGNGWTPTTLATTVFTGLDGNGDIDIRLHARSGRVWIDWEDAADSLGWCRLESGGWSSPRYEPVSSPNDEEAARLRIQRQALRGGGQ